MRPLLPARQVIEKATASAREFEDSERMRVAFSGVRAHRATLVQRLDDFDRYYYIVGFGDGTRETARMALDAFDGRFLELNGIQKPDERLMAYLTAEAMLERVNRDAEKHDAKSLRFQVRPESVGQHPVLVWLACAQSSSPFLPFYQYSVGDSFLYYRVDGKRFERLTTGPA